MEALRNRVPDTTTAVTLLELQRESAQNNNQASPAYSHQFQHQQIRENDYTSPVSMSVSTHSHPSQPQTHPEVNVPFPQPFIQSPAGEYGIPSLKRKRGDFELNVERSVDVVSRGLISLSDAEVYFGTFFQGCVSFSS